MYILSIPKNKTNIIDIMDKLIINPVVHLPDVKTSRMLGMYIRPWHRKGFIGIYQDSLLRDSFVKCNVGNIEKRIGMGKRVEYTIDDSFLTSKIKIPRL